MAAVPPARTTVRGFHGTPVTSGDDDSDSGAGSVHESSKGSASTGMRRGRKQRHPALDDVVSANCSPVLRPAGSPAMSGITKLRMQLEPLSLSTSAASSRAGSPAARVAPPQGGHNGLERYMSPLAAADRRASSKASHRLTDSDLSQAPTTAGGVSSRSTSNDAISSHTSNTSGDELESETAAGKRRNHGGDDASTSYVIRLEHDFVSESVLQMEQASAAEVAEVAEGAVERDGGEQSAGIFDADMDDLCDQAGTPGGASPAAIAGTATATADADGSGINSTTPRAADNVHTTRTPPAPPARKMTSDDFEPLRCLGKGSYGTVLLVKQTSTGRLYAQKQFKKASLVVHKKLVQQTKTERQILEQVNRHPFVVKLYYAFQDHEKLYLILEYGQGGELFTHLSAERMFSEPTAAFYMAEMVLALSHLHDTLGVVYRDLKPENCLLDAEGHLLLTDFGLSKVALPGVPGGGGRGRSGSTASEGSTATDDACCNSILGTVEYMAPEVVQGKAYGRAVDWWSFGALLYDLLTGNPPFRGRNNAKIQENIVKQRLVLPYFLTPDAKDLLTRLLRKDPRKRLGAHMPRDLATIKGHRFFRRIDWAQLAARAVEPPIQPVITDPELAENFAAEFTDLPLSPRATASSPWGRDGGDSSNKTATTATTAAAATAATTTSRGRGRSIGGAGSGSLNKDDPFGGFSFVASTSLLNEANFGYPA